MLISQDCFQCLVNTMQTIPTDPCQASIGAKYSHGGSIGRLLLSKRPLQDVATQFYDTFAIKRGVTYAKISGVQFAFPHLPQNYLEDFDSSLGPFMSGALQLDVASDTSRRRRGYASGISLRKTRLRSYWRSCGLRRGHAEGKAKGAVDDVGL